MVSQRRQFPNVVDEPLQDTPEAWAHIRQRLIAASEQAYADPADEKAIFDFTCSVAFSGLPDGFLTDLGRQMRLADLLVVELGAIPARALCSRLTDAALRAGPHACHGLAHLFIGTLGTTVRLCMPPRGHAKALSALSALVESTSTLRKSLPPDEARRLKQKVKATLSAA